MSFFAISVWLQLICLAFERKRCIIIHCYPCLGTLVTYVSSLYREVRREGYATQRSAADALHPLSLVPSPARGEGDEYRDAVVGARRSVPLQA